jgi:hypothetical protein
VPRIGKTIQKNQKRTKTSFKNFAHFDVLAWLIVQVDVRVDRKLTPGKQKLQLTNIIGIYMCPFSLINVL